MSESTGYCGACGEPNSYDDAFCIKCGKRLAWADGEELTEELPPPPKAEEPLPQPEPAIPETQSTSPAPVKFAAPMPQHEQNKLTNVKPQSYAKPLNISSCFSKMVVTIGVVCGGLFLLLIIITIIAPTPTKNQPATPAIAPQTIPKPPSAAQIQAQKKAAARQAEIDRQAALQAQQPAKPDEQLQQQDAKFGDVLNIINLKYGLTLVTKSGTKDNGDTVIIQVDDAWHSMNKQVRLENAQLMGDAWATIHGDYVENHRPRREATPGFSIVDNAGNEVGGYTSWKGFWVQD